MRRAAQYDKVKELSTLIAVVANDQSLGLTLNEEGHCFIEYEKRHITISDKVVPKPFRVHPVLVQKWRQAFAQHEAQHWVFTKDMVETVKDWIGHKPFPDLASLLHNITEDYRVNTWLIETYSWDIGARVQWMVEGFGRCWEATYTRNMREVVGTEKEDSVLLDPLNWLNQGLIACALYGMDADRYAELHTEVTGDVAPDELVERIKEVCDLIWRAKYTPSDRILELHEKVYGVVARYAMDWFEREDMPGSTQKKLKLIKRKRQEMHQGGTPVPGQGGDGGDGPLGPISEGGGHGGSGPVNKGLIPVQFGGDLQQDGPAPGKEGEDDGPPRGNCPDSPGEDYATVAGRGAGLESPSPVPDEGAYISLVNRNMPYITTLLNKMKRLMQQKLRHMKFQKSGKLMAKQLARACIQRRPVENIYTRKRFYMQKQSVRLTLVVDMSGSMSTSQARDALTTIAEVGGRWLNDEDFAVFVFGDSYQKVKAFGESYRNTRARIGGVQCMGGTELAPCLRQIHRMYKSYIDNHKQVVLIVSDFCVFDEPETTEVLKMMRRDGIIPVGVGYCGTSLENVRSFTGKNSTYVRSVSELPDLVFETFRRASL